MPHDILAPDSNTRAAISQILFVGGPATLVVSLRNLLAEERLDFVHVPARDWASADWQSARRPGPVWAVIAFPDEDDLPFEDYLHCVQVVSLAYRPNRLVVLKSRQSQEQVIFLLRAGADGVVSAGAPPEEIVQELEGPGLRHEDLFPDPIKWLHSLSRAAQELGLAEDPSSQLRRLLRSFASQLHVDRASVSLVTDGELTLAAGINMPAEVREGMSQAMAPGTITEWVVNHRRARLIEGSYSGTPGTGGSHRSEARSAVCAPLLMHGDLLGVVSFTSLQGGRMLNQADLATAEVFASMLALSISNHRLHLQMIEKERLATVGATISTVSHCIKNLLTILKGSTGIMQMALDRQDFGQVVAGYQMTQKGVSRLENLALDLLDFCKAREPDFFPVKLSEFVANVEESFNLLNLHRRHRLTTVLEQDGDYELDEPRLQRAVLNLLSNSVDATPTGGDLLLTVSVADNILNLVVEDNGPGVPEKKLESIFQPFYSTKGSKGTGLGLAMVSKFCTECGGSCAAAPSKELGGLAVRISLPLRTRDDREADGEPEM